ncbi:hypothetical protein ACHWQZ_G014286 [Mnemiopsis leidyi]
MVYNTRSHSYSDDLQGYQPAYPQERTRDIDRRISDMTPTLDHMYNTLLAGLEPKSDFEKAVHTYLGLLHSQVKEIKIEQGKLREEIAVRSRNVMETVDEMKLSVVKTEQYGRRDTVTIVGLSKPDNETEKDLSKKVAEALSNSGETVVPDDFSAIHRNSKDNRHVRGKVIPPSITVRFSRISKKDNVLRSYRNFDPVAKKPRDVKVYQSLTKHYSDLRISIYKFLNPDPSSPESSADGKICNVDGLKPKWVTYQSPTSGFAVKLASGEYFNNVHVWGDFESAIMSRFPNCRR